VLCSPHIALAPTPERGAELDAFVLRESRLLRERAGLRGEITLTAAASVVASRDDATASSLRKLAAAAKAMDRSPNTHAFFADEVRKLLRVAGWPGPAELSSLEYQAIDRWEEMLDRLSTLDLLSRRVTFSTFVDDLTELARETIFAPENTGAPVQVVNVTEGAGSTSDALWFLHADDATWPPHHAPHPLIPWHLQRSLGIPGSDTALDEDAAKRATERCIHSAGQAVFSYANSHTAGQRRPSALISSLPQITLQATGPGEVSAAEAELDLIEETLPLPALPDAVASGGVSVLTAQAQCGFRAFAERRLFLRDLESIEAGLSQRDRGEQVHTILQFFWEEVKSQAELVRISKVGATGESQRDTLLRRCIEEAFRNTVMNAWDAAYLNVQRERLFRLLSDWLDTEARRPPFTVMHIDQVGSPEDGTPATVLIDYKTGRVERKDWVGDRLDAPQLPVYAIAGGMENVRAIAFGSVRVGKDGNRFDDMTDQPLLGNKLKKNFVFDEQLAAWKRDLTALAEAFARGEAGVDPKDHRITCKHCAQRLLCRLDLTKLEPDDDLLEEEEDVPAW
jgi:probable DNA repair protein